MTQPDRFNITIIGERINPGFKSVKSLFDKDDIAGIQALAVKQAEGGAAYLDVNIGPRALVDPEFMAYIVRALQEAVSVPLCFDFPSKPVQEICLKTYDQDRAGGRPPMVNSITEARWELMDLYRMRPFKVVVMTSERMDNGVARGNKTADEIATTAKRAAERLVREYGMKLDDIYLDMTVSAAVADTEGLNRSTIEAIGRIGADPELKGVHMMGGLTNIGQQLPPKAADGSDLKLGLENAFLTLTVPLGFDTILGTPWRDYHPLADDDYVFSAFRHFLTQTGTNALRAVRKFYRA